MTAYKFTSHRQLRDALNSVEKVQKQNIDEYSWGHLNEKNLFKPPGHLTKGGSGRIWRSSKKRKTVVKDTDLIPGLQTYRQKQEKDKRQEMKDVLYEFSLGTMGSVPMPSPNCTETPKREKIDSFRRETSNVSKVSDDSQKPRAESGKSLYSELDDGILVEELGNNELMVKSPQLQPSYFPPKRLKPDDPDYDIMADLTQTLDSEGYLTLKHSFLPSFTSGVTKSDQFNKLRQFEDVVLRKQECREMKVLSGVKAVEHLERRLEEVSTFLFLVIHLNKM